MADVLSFLVKGGAAQPYQVKAYGTGGDLYMSCSCPAGRRRGAFCKHKAALLVGDVTAVHEGADFVSELAERAKGSPLQAQAFRQSPEQNSREMKPRFKSLDEFAAFLDRLLDSDRWHVDRDYKAEAFQIEGLFLFKKLKNGSTRKHPFYSMYFVEKTYDSVVSESGEIEMANIRDRTRPWVVRANNARTETFGYLAPAMREFLRRLNFDSLV